MVRVMIVDDQALFRAGLAALLEGADAVEVVAQAGGAAEALGTFARARPDVVLMDMHMPGTNGAECTRQLLASHPGVRVIALTTFDDDETVLAAIKAGAQGYLLKDATADQLVGAIHSVASGQSAMDPGVLHKVLGELRRAAGEAGTEPHGLSERELHVLRGLMDGKSNKEIGHELSIAEGTVKNHLTSIFGKLGVTDRTSAALRARDLGLGKRR
jgi:DNA-binding NarL/FixJ family response regulator